MLATVNTLERAGKIVACPIVELFAEANFNRLSGTFRLSREAIKIAVYFADGKIVFAQSNLRAARLAVKLAQANLVCADDLSDLQNLPDVEVAARLVAANKIGDVQLAACQNNLISEIARAALELRDGEWTFNPLVRVREDLRADVDLQTLLVKAARRLPPETLAARFGETPLETIAPALKTAGEFELTVEEAFVLSRLNGMMSAATAATATGLPASQTLAAIYVLWLGGFVRRFNYAQIFDQSTIEQFHRARHKMRLVATANQQAVNSPQTTQPATTTQTNDENANNNKEADQAEAIENYLRAVEAARNNYEILNVAQNVDQAAIKTAYFRFAKNFHPDKFHAEVGNEKHARLQNAFTRVAAAYEVLKDQKSRELYDFKLQKELEQPAQAVRREEAAFKPEVAFEQGMAALKADDFAQAVAFLNRAVQLAPANAEYHARLGQALAVNPKFRHKAETEFQTALKLDEKNAEWRLILAEFYVLTGLNRRAEAELNRLLNQEPGNRLALEMLGKIK